jgi:hypothetical protein
MGAAGRQKLIKSAKRPPDGRLGQPQQDPIGSTNNVSIVAVFIKTHQI